MEEPIQLVSMQDARPAATSTGHPRSEEIPDTEEETHIDHIPVAGALSTFDVFALIVNKMVGTGIFTAPTLVLALTESRELSIFLWIAGSIYSIIRCASYSLQYMMLIKTEACLYI